MRCSPRCRRPRPRTASRTPRREVAVQLAVVGDARVGRQARLQVHQPLDRASAARVAAELDLRIGDHGQRPRQLRRHPPRLVAKAQLLAKSWRVPRERPGAHERVDARRISPQRRGERPVRARVEGRVAGLTRAGQVACCRARRSPGRARRTLAGGARWRRSSAPPSPPAPPRRRRAVRRSLLTGVPGLHAGRRCGVESARRPRQVRERGRGTACRSGPRRRPAARRCPSGSRPRP